MHPWELNVFTLAETLGVPVYKLRDMPVSELKDWMLYYEHKTKEMQAAQGKAGNADGSINLLENPEVLLKNFMGTS